MRRRYSRLTASILVLVLMFSVCPMHPVHAEEIDSSTTENGTEEDELPADEEDEVPAEEQPQSSPADEEAAELEVPAVRTVGSGIHEIWIPLSADNQDTTYAVALTDNQGDLEVSPEAESYINVWKKTGGTQEFVYVVGHQLGTAAFKLGEQEYKVHVVPRNEKAPVDRRIKVTVSEYDSENVVMYYSINGSELYRADSDRIVMDQDFPGGFNIMIFAAPKEGYALTKLIANAGKGQFYSLAGEKADGSDSNAWPFVNEEADDAIDLNTAASWKGDPLSSNAIHGFSGCLKEGNMTVSGLRDLLSRAKALRCDGVLTYTRNGNNGNGLDVTISCEVEQLPEMKMEISAYKKKDGKDFLPYSAENPPELEIGDILRYTFTIVRHGSTNVNYQDIVLDASEMLGENAKWSWKTQEDLPAGSDPIVKTVDYTLRDGKDEIWKYAGGSFTVTAKLTYQYESKFSRGMTKISNEAEAACSISKLVLFKWCGHLSKELADKIALPDTMVVPFGTKFKLPAPAVTVYEAKENGYITGTYKFICWGAKESARDPETNDSMEVETGYFMVGDELTMPNAGSLTFQGHWHFFPAPQYTVAYQWIGLPEGVDPGLPTDGSTYYKDQSFAVDGYFQAGDTYKVGTETYVFQGWKLKEMVVSGTAVMPAPEGEAAGITLTGEWVKESALADLKLQTKGCKDIDGDQTFLFQIEGEGMELTIILHGNETVTIPDLRIGKTYTVKALEDWSWRYKVDGERLERQITIGSEQNSVIYEYTRSVTKWLDGNHFRNIFKKQ